MENENVVNNEQQPIDNIEQFNMEKYNELKANTVSKDKYNKLEQSYKDLFNSYANGETYAAASPEAPKKSLDELRDELFRPKEELNNLQFVEKALELRERVIEETGEDCFVSKGHNITPTEQSYIAAQRVADIFQECIDYANGDSKVFTNELQRRMPDSPLINNKFRR